MAHRSASDLKYAFYPSWQYGHITVEDRTNGINFALQLEYHKPVFIMIMAYDSSPLTDPARVDFCEVWNEVTHTWNRSCKMDYRMMPAYPWRPLIANDQALRLVVNPALFQFFLRGKNGDFRVRIGLPVFVYDSKEDKLRFRQYIVSTPFQITLKDGQLADAVECSEFLDTEAAGGLRWNRFDVYGNPGAFVIEPPYDQSPTSKRSEILSK